MQRAAFVKLILKYLLFFRSVAEGLCRFLLQPSNSGKSTKGVIKVRAVHALISVLHFGYLFIWMPLYFIFVFNIQLLKKKCVHSDFIEIILYRHTKYNFIHVSLSHYAIRFRLYRKQNVVLGRCLTTAQNIHSTHRRHVSRAENPPHPIAPIWWWMKCRITTINYELRCIRDFALFARATIPYPPRTRPMANFDRRPRVYT